MKTVLRSLFVACLFLSVLSCKKEKTQLSVQEYLTASTWKMKSKIITPSFLYFGETISDGTVFDSEEVKQYTYKHQADGTAIQFNSAGKAIFQTKWTISPDEKYLTYNPGIVFNYPVVGDMSLGKTEIIRINEHEMVLRILFVFQVNYTVDMVFVPVN
jgi:hypothetical protein